MPLRFSRLLRLCMYPTCQRYLGVSVPTKPGHTGLSHGICASCLATHFPAQPNEGKH